MWQEYLPWSIEMDGRKTRNNGTIRKQTKIHAVSGHINIGLYVAIPILLHILRLGKCYIHPHQNSSLLHNGILPNWLWLKNLLYPGLNCYVSSQISTYVPLRSPLFSQLVNFLFIFVFRFLCPLLFEVVVVFLVKHAT